MGRQSNRQRILDTAIGLAEREGIRALTIDSVAAASGLTKGGVQYHFVSKDAMIGAVVQEMWEQADDAAQEALGRPFEDASHAERLTALIDSFVGTPARAGTLLIWVDSARHYVHAERAREHYRRWASTSEGAITIGQWIALLAADGLWLHEATGGGVIPDDARTRVVEVLTDLAQERCVIPGGDG